MPRCAANERDCAPFFSISLSDSPGGHCRQFLHELPAAKQIRVLITSDGEDDCGGGDERASSPRDGDAIVDTSLAALLPQSFGPADLGVDSYALPPAPVALELLSSSTATRDPELTARALEAAERSRAPFSGRLAGVALRTARNQVYAGSYIESAAYNPSVPALQAAVLCASHSLAGPTFDCTGSCAGSQ